MLNGSRDLKDVSITAHNRCLSLSRTGEANYTRHLAWALGWARERDDARGAAKRAGRVRAPRPRQRAIIQALESTFILSILCMQYNVSSRTQHGQNIIGH